MKTIYNLFATSALFTAFYYSPVITLLTILTALFTMSIIASFCNQRTANDAVLDQSYTDLKDAFDDIFDDAAPELSEIADKPSSEQVPTAPTVHNEQHDDIWHTTEATTCDFACQVSFPEYYEQPVLALPAGVVVEEVVIVDYTELSYKELKAKVKALRTDKSIKLNSKRSVLIEWLTNNAPAS